jgi:hypothetical protein
MKLCVCIAAIALSIVFAAQVSARAMCGERGGPGYRGPDGRCVGWLDIGKTCGCPPTTRCTLERVRVGAEHAAELGCQIETLRGQPAPQPPPSK